MVSQIAMLDIKDCVTVGAKEKRERTQWVRQLASVILLHLEKVVGNFSSVFIQNACCLYMLLVENERGFMGKQIRAVVIFIFPFDYVSVAFSMNGLNDRFTIINNY